MSETPIFDEISAEIPYPQTEENLVENPAALDPESAGTYETPSETDPPPVMNDDADDPLDDVEDGEDDGDTELDGDDDE